MGVHSARGGQDYYLLMCEDRAGLEFCPIHRFDRMDKIPVCLLEACHRRKFRDKNRGAIAQVH